MQEEGIFWIGWSELLEIQTPAMPSESTFLMPSTEVLMLLASLSRN
jgi:hypothetical protein